MTFVLALFSKFVRWFRPEGVRAPQTVVKCLCSEKALTVIAEQLQAHGARVIFESETHGRVESEAGVLTFGHSGCHLTVVVIEDRGHFPAALLIGGIKQTVEEANEIVRRAHVQNFNPSVSAEESANA